MDIAYTPEQEALRQELRTYFAGLMTPEVEAECAAGETGGPHCLDAVKAMGRDGWLGIGWPVEYGGQGRSEIEQFIFFDEAWRAGAPIPFLTVNTVGRTIMAFGTEEQKQAFLQPILRGELHCSIGYTEPGAGTDLASLRTTAVRDGDEWVINGQKIFTSLASYADYIWLAARTDPDAPKHKGITIFMVPTTAPGFSFTKIGTMVNASTFNTYYEDVRVPLDAVVGDVNRGWDLIVNQLNYERVSLCPPGSAERMYEDVRRWAQETKLADGRRVVDQEWVQVSLARVHAKLDVPPAHELEGGVGIDQPGRRQRDEGVRHRVLLRGVPAADGDRRPVQRRAAGLDGCRAARAPRAGVPGDVDPDVRRRHERGATRPCRPVRLGPAPDPEELSSMDFAFTEEQQAVSELAGRILSERLPAERLREIELDPSGSWFAEDVWRALAKAELLGLCLPEDVGGSGYGILEACLLLEQQGRAVAPLPLLPTLVYGALPIAKFGTDEQRAELLPGVATGDTILTAALHEGGSFAATPADGRWRLDGECQFVPALHLASRVLVPARMRESTVGIFVVDPAAPGVSSERMSVTNDEPQWALTLDGVEVGDDEVLGDPERGDEMVQWIVDHAIAGLCATAAGVCSRAVEITAGYVSEREQFGAKIGTFQAVSQRAADAWIDAEAIRLTAWEAAWRLSVERPAAEALATAKFWAADGGQRVVHAAQHLHGGIGMDIDYPIHRYFRWAKQLELTLGGATVSLLRLGAMLAADPV